MGRFIWLKNNNNKNNNNNNILTLVLYKNKAHTFLIAQKKFCLEDIGKNVTVMVTIL